MKSTDWGKLIARVMAVVLALDAVQVASSAWPTISQESIGIGDKLSYLFPAAFCAIVAVLAWVFADRFAPAEDRVRESTVDASFVGAVVLGAVAGYLFLTYGITLVDSLIRRTQADPALAPPSDLIIVYDLLVCIGCATLVVYTRRVAEWMAR